MPQKTLIILGPTGSGKTPLGDCLEQEGLNGIKCFHFDFGFHLRKIAKFGKGSNLNLYEIQTVKKALKENALLEDETFNIAEKILTCFQKTQTKSENDILVMNGLPRHEGQAEDLGHLIDIKALICLNCTPEISLKRIAADSGGDRGVRKDDPLEEIQRKLRIFSKRTAPLISYYKNNNVPVINIEVKIGTQPENIISQLNL